MSAPGEPLDATERLSTGSLMAAASQETGLKDFGDDRFLEPFERFLSTVLTEANVSEPGSIGLAAHIHRLLVNRLRFEADLRAHPEISEEQVDDPILIVGLPRTGTTKLQRMMAQDPGLQNTAVWQLLNPAPFPDAGEGGRDPRIAFAEAYASQLPPAFKAAHAFSAEDPEEEPWMTEMTFDNLSFFHRFHIPSYRKWWSEARSRYPYEYLRALLGYLQWQDGGRQGRPFLLKSTAHLGALDIVTDVFPAVTIVQTHRHPYVSMSSWVRLMLTTRSMFSDQVDPEELAEEMLEFWAGETLRGLAQRDALGDDRIVDVDYNQLMSDPLAVARSIFERRGTPMTAAAEQGIMAWCDRNPQHKHGKHAYEPGLYGLTEERVEAAFEPYIERFLR